MLINLSDDTICILRAACDKALGAYNRDAILARDVLGNNQRAIPIKKDRLERAAQRVEQIEAVIDDTKFALDMLNEMKR